MKIPTIAKLNAKLNATLISRILTVKQQGPKLFLKSIRILRKRILPSANLPTDRMF